MKMKEGWDGSEEENNIQWTFAGALFYSIIVITTIGESIFKAWSKLWRRAELAEAQEASCHCVYVFVTKETI
jgi:hypothetical protein